MRQIVLFSTIILYKLYPNNIDQHFQATKFQADDQNSLKTRELGVCKNSLELVNSSFDIPCIILILLFYFVPANCRCPLRPPHGRHFGGEEGTILVHPGARSAPQLYSKYKGVHLGAPQLHSNYKGVHLSALRCTSII